MDFIKRYFREPVNGITHLVGALLSLVGLFFLLQVALSRGSINHVIAFSVFGVSATLLYTVSALYHSLKARKQIIALLQRLDHSAIYIKIAGTYTPICLIVLDGDLRWSFLIGVWAFAAAGIIKKFTWKDAPNWITVSLYLIMGWIGVFLFPILFEKLPAAFLFWLILGGLAYTLGVVILAGKRPNPFPGKFGYHEIWHLFVMAGTFSHFWAIYRYLPGYGI